jgi:hypothetical protein
MWLGALDAMELHGETPSLQEELAEAETKLAAAVKEWRLAGGRESAYV